MNNCEWNFKIVGDDEKRSNLNLLPTGKFVVGGSIPEDDRKEFSIEELVLLKRIAEDFELLKLKKIECIEL